MVCFLLCPDTPPERADAKGGKGVEQGKFIAAQHNPNQFALGLKDACCVEPGCCILSGLGAPFGLTACWTRKAVLDKYAGGMQNYVCFQGYIPNCCCMDTSDMCRGSELGLCLEGCCCPVFSISIARLHLMDAKRIRPDPWDYQIIAFSNCLQLASCILDVIAIFVEEAREAANIVDLIADLVTLSVAGCMGAQINHEIKTDANGIKEHPVVIGIPVAQGGPTPAAEEMAR